jgi:hypothetical protein
LTAAVRRHAYATRCVLLWFGMVYCTMCAGTQHFQAVRNRNFKCAEGAAGASILHFVVVRNTELLVSMTQQRRRTCDQSRQSCLPYTHNRRCRCLPRTPRRHPQVLPRINNVSSSGGSGGVASATSAALLCYWCALTAAGLWCVPRWAPRLPRTAARKLFHLLLVALLAPGVLAPALLHLWPPPAPPLPLEGAVASDDAMAAAVAAKAAAAAAAELTALAGAVGCAALVAVEAARALSLPPVGAALDAYYHVFLADRCVTGQRWRVSTRCETSGEATRQTVMRALRCHCCSLQRLLWPECCALALLALVASPLPLPQ